MAKINNISDFKNITSNITSFSHAYLFNVNSLDLAYSYIKEFAKMIILGNNYDENDENNETTIYQIDNDEYDDLYIVNPSTIGINTEEINKLMTYMETKSLRDNGKRVYIIYGFERLTRDVSNKILKFLEEPTENVYALLITENIERILPTIISRCQKLDLVFPNATDDLDRVKRLIGFLDSIILNGKKTIAYEYDYFSLELANRIEFYLSFEILEKIISQTINKSYNHLENDNYLCESLLAYPRCTLTNILNITNKLKCLIKGNINLPLLLDRYIIEITEELGLCKK